MSGPSTRPPPGAGSQSFEPAPPKPVTPSGLRWLPFLFGAGAVFWLVQLVQFAAVVAAPNGRDQLQQAVIQAGAKGDVSTLLVVEIGLVFFIVAAAAGLYFLVPDYFRPMFSSPLGWVLIGISAGMLVIGNVIIRRITKIA